jgi:hypothetical protein
MQFFFALGFEYFVSNPKDAELQEIFNGQFLEHDYRGTQPSQFQSSSALRARRLRVFGAV